MGKISGSCHGGGTESDEKMKSMMKKLQGPHPYVAGRIVELEVPWSESAPENVSGKRCRSGVAEAGQNWFPLAGPFFLSLAADEVVLLSLLWDLDGQPMIPGHGQRPRARYLCAETEPGTVTVYRDTMEVKADT